jgi:DNA repair exonuclease SbcCD ATPase subunit
MKVTIEKVSMKNFLSVGNKWLTVDFRKGLYRVTGENLDNNTKNGVGKCVDGDTEVEVTNSYLKEYSSTTTVKKIVDFYEKYPESKGTISVKTPYGFKKIEEAKQTDYSIPLKIVTSKNKSVICSKQHRFKTNETDFKKAQDFKVNDEILTEDGLERIKEVTILTNEQPLYDFQVEEVEQYYTNGIVSHNSSIFLDSLMFGLFGKPIRKVSLTDLANSINGGKGCEIKLYLKVEEKSYMIYRGINPSFLKLYENYNDGDENLKENENEKQDGAKKFTQKRIDDLIGSNFNTLSHLLIMSNTYTAPFLDLDAKKKREIIEDILGISIFGSMAEKAKESSLEMKSDLKLQEKQYEINKANLNSLEVNISKLKEKESEFEITKKNKLQAIKDKLKLNISKINNLTSELVDENELTPKLLALKTNIDKIKNKLNELTQSSSLAKRISNNNNNILNELKDKPTCPICNTETSSEHITNHINKLKDEITNSVELIKKNNNLCFSLIEKEKDIISKIDYLTNQIQETKLNIKLIEKLNEEKNRFKDEVNQIKNEKNNFSDLINEDELINKRNELIKLESTINELSINKQYYEYIRKLLSDDGVKNYIIKKIVKYWNTKVNYYLRELNAEFSIEFNESLDAVIKARNRDPLQYHSFSGGEKARIDVAILLSVVDISKLQNSIDLNIMVIDELLDGGLDDNGREDVLNLFKQMTLNQDKSIYVISHNSNLPTDLFDKEITLIKKNGFSSFKE